MLNEPLESNEFTLNLAKLTPPFLVLPCVGIPLFISDLAPDRWGRNLIAKGIQMEARRLNKPLPTIDDYEIVLCK